MSVKQIAIDRAVVMLKAAGAQFVILNEAGEKITHGNIDIAVPVERKRRTKTDRPIGALINYYGPFLAPLKAGDSATVPRGDFNLKEIRAAMSAYACHKWGKKSAIVATKDDDHVEILRLI